MIGEQFDHGDEICGAVVNVRARQEKIAMWTKNAANESAQVCLLLYIWIILILLILVCCVIAIYGVVLNVWSAVIEVNVL